MKAHLREVLAASGGILILLLNGCDMAGAQPERAGGTLARGATDFASRRLEGAGLAEVQPVAERVFRSYFRVDPAASSATDLVAFPTDVSREERAAAASESTPEEGAGGQRPRETVGDVIGVAPRRYRRVAELRLVAGNDAVTTQVRVMLQRLTTTERTAFARARGDDRPTDTPIDRLGAASTTAREEWRDYQRDRRLEREILNAIQAGTAATQPAGG